MIPRLLNASPGLYSMADLPVPAAMLGDARGFVQRD
jgi:4-hydroxy-tetrahydrodipicolinate reductase